MISVATLLSAGSIGVAVGGCEWNNFYELAEKYEFVYSSEYSSGWKLNHLIPAAIMSILNLFNSTISILIA